MLVIEDEPMICALLSDVLEAEGFETHCVQTDREAYAALRGDAGVGCLIVDVNLGVGNGGYDVARFARQIDPALPVIYVSGRASQRSLEANRVTRSLFLPKPFKTEALLHLIHTLVGDNDD